MQPTIFYQQSRGSAYQAQLISPAQWVQMSHEPCVAFSGQLGEWWHDAATQTIFVGIGSATPAQALVEGVMKLPAGAYRFDCELSDEAALLWALSQYRFDRYKPSHHPVRRLVLSKAAYTRVLRMADAIFLVRDLINTPTQDLGPFELVAVAKVLASSFHAKFSVIEGEALLKQNYPAVHAVGRASHMPPCFIELSWGKKTHPLIALIGKGVCFDSGGLDIKGASAMRLMKKDMGGAAHVLGLAKWIMASRLPVRLLVLIPAVENAIGSRAYRPGDVIRMRNGLTVEIENTDAEGRLVMADALARASEEKPALLMDFSTLTGAARIAVGTEIAAMFSNNDQVANELLHAALMTHDPIWRLPLFEPYTAMLTSAIADLMNASSSSYAGAITAALFLQHFVGANLPWVHFDLMAWNLSNKPGKPEGGEAMAFRAVAYYLQQRFGMNLL